VRFFSGQQNLDELAPLKFPSTCINRALQHLRRLARPVTRTDQDDDPIDSGGQPAQIAPEPRRIADARCQRAEKNGRSSSPIRVASPSCLQMFSTGKRGFGPLGNTVVELVSIYFGGSAPGSASVNLSAITSYFLSPSGERMMRVRLPFSSRKASVGDFSNVASNLR
jgi:hypothetical protein